MNLPPRDCTSGPVVRPAPEMAMSASQGSMLRESQLSKLSEYPLVEAASRVRASRGGAAQKVVQRYGRRGRCGLAGAADPLA